MINISSYAKYREKVYTCLLSETCGNCEMRNLFPNCYEKNASALISRFVKGSKKPYPLNFRYENTGFRKKIVVEFDITDMEEENEIIRNISYSG